MKFKKTHIRKANPVKLSRVLGTLVKNIGIGPDIIFEKRKKDWQEIVGKPYARNTRPVSLKTGVLTIAVSPAWITRARFDKASFLDRIRDYETKYKVDIYDIQFNLER